jgi:F-type H+-transporting ATPase subunit delta
MAKLSALYASALFDLAMEGGDATDEYLKQAVLLRDSLMDDECMRVLLHPHISAAEKRKLFGKVFAGQINDDLFGFLYLVIEKNREAFLLPALVALIGMIERHQRKAKARILSAAALDEKQVTALREMLAGKLNKNVEVSPKVDPSLIGGPYIYVDGYYIDRTIKKRLHDLTAHMKERCGA